MHYKQYWSLHYKQILKFSILAILKYTLQAILKFALQAILKYTLQAILKYTLQACFWIFRGGTCLVAPCCGPMLKILTIVFNVYEQVWITKEYWEVRQYANKPNSALTSCQLQRPRTNLKIHSSIQSCEGHTCSGHNAQTSDCFTTFTPSWNSSNWTEINARYTKFRDSSVQVRVWCATNANELVFAVTAWGVFSSELGSE